MNPYWVRPIRFYGKFIFRSICKEVAPLDRKTKPTNSWYLFKCFQVYRCMTYPLLIMINLKITKMIYILISLNSSWKMIILVKAHFEPFIKIHNIKFSNKFFDKRDAFPFYVNHMVYLDRSIQTKYFTHQSFLKFFLLLRQQ